MCRCACLCPHEEGRRGSGVCLLQAVFFFLVRPEASKSQRPSIPLMLGVTGVCVTLSLSHECWDLNSGPQDCTANALSYQDLFLFPPRYFSRQGICLSLRFMVSGRLGGSPRICLSRSPTAGVTGVHCHVWLFRGCWGCELGFSGLHRKHFPHQLVFPVP